MNEHSADKGLRPPKLDPILFFQHYYGIDRRQARRRRRRLARACVIPSAGQVSEREG